MHGNSRSAYSERNVPVSRHASGCHSPCCHSCCDNRCESRLFILIDTKSLWRRLLCYELLQFCKKRSILLPVFQTQLQKSASSWGKMDCSSMAGSISDTIGGYMANIPPATDLVFLVIVISFLTKSVAKGALFFLSPYFKRPRRDRPFVFHCDS